MNTKWLIWSNEHKAWWRENSRGYTMSRNEAGRYSMTEAMEICLGANKFQGDLQVPSETMLQDITPS